MARPKDPANTIYKICPTCKKEFTHEKRKPKTYCSKSCAANSDIVKEKNRKGVKHAFDEKYGGHPMSVNDATMNNFKNSMVKKYGVEFAPQMNDFSKKVKATKKELHGDENYNNVDKMKMTCLERYGVDNYRKTEEYRKKYQETCLKRYGVVHASMVPTRKEQINASTFRMSHKLTMFKKFLESEKFKNFEPLFNLEEYDGVTVRHNHPYKFRCKRCNLEHEYDLTRQHLRCPSCDNTISIFQGEVIDFVKRLLPNEPIVVNNRTLLSPLEIDIFVPSKNIAIETDGLYWHSEVSGNKDKNYHLNKTKISLSKGVRLLHVLESEWNEHPEIVKRVLKNIILHPVSDKETVFVVREITSQEKKEFLEKYNLYGNDASMIRLGLFSTDTLVAVMTFTKSKFNKTMIEWELSRFSSTVGHAEQLFEYFVKHYDPKSVSVQCDRRYFSGETFANLGFVFTRHSPPVYHYIIDGYKSIEPKFNWVKTKQQKKLKEYNPAFTEWENMKINGFDRIWDCGHSKWVWTKKS